MPSTSDAPVRAPAWFRYGVVAAAAIIMCSCRAPAADYRVAQSSGPQSSGPVLSPRATVRLQSPSPAPQPVAPGSATCPPGGGCLPIPGGCNGCRVCMQDGLPGPRDEYLCDGGDYGVAVGVRANWQIDGLEQEDAIAHYDTIDGRTVVTPSNRVCIYAPRFAAVRQVVDLRAVARYDHLVGAVQQIAPVRIDEREEASTSLASLEPTIHRVQEPPSLLRERQQGGELARDRRAAVTLGTLAPYADVQLIRSGEAVGVDVMRIARSSLAAITWAGDQAAQVVLDSRRAHAEVSVQSPGTIYHVFEPNNPRLRLVKLASTDAALPGEEVEFTLRFDNIGDRVIGNVTIVDSLSTRLEYVPDSQKSTVKADFSTEQNEGGSLILRWEIVEPVQPGEGGVLQFRCRVR